ncbi:hypothetical protein KCP76_21080 [Salmonella enterica subsp. enterica serovar Weltevreden]|nr:hypothetical protein KCP76_21080 [Salmonella enterica subsp. enterica serovar Weltevreden]
MGINVCIFRYVEGNGKAWLRASGVPAEVRAITIIVFPAAPVHEALGSASMRNRRRRIIVTNSPQLIRLRSARYRRVITGTLKRKTIHSVADRGGRPRPKRRFFYWVSKSTARLTAIYPATDEHGRDCMADSKIFHCIGLNAVIFIHLRLT